MLSAVWVWPLYMAALYVLGRGGRFRLALALCPLLVAGMSIANLALQVPEVQATDLGCVLFALRSAPRRSHARCRDPAREQVGSAASCRAARRPVRCGGCCRTSVDRPRRSTPARCWWSLLIAAALATSSVRPGCAGNIEALVCQISGQTCDGSSATGSDELDRRLAALDPLLNATGGALEDLAQQAQAAIARGDLDTARDLIERLELYRDLIGAGPRGELVSRSRRPERGGLRRSRRAGHDPARRRREQPALLPAPGRAGAGHPRHGPVHPRIERRTAEG